MNRPSHILFLLLFLIAAAGCFLGKQTLKAKVDIPPTALKSLTDSILTARWERPDSVWEAPFPAAFPTPASVRLTKGDCIGTCSVFELTLLSSGEAYLIAFQDMQPTGVFRAPLPEKTWLALQENWEKLNFFALPASFPPNGPFIEVLPSWQVEIQWEDKTKTVLANHHIPLAYRRFLTALTDLIDQLEWTPVDDH